MSPRISQIVLVDSGFWFAAFNERDQHHADAKEYAEFLLDFRLVVPWPTLYETLRTRFSRQPIAVRKFESFLKRPNASLLDDAPYKQAALDATLSPSGKRYSIVDNVLRLILADANVRVDCLFSFNRTDFRDICVRRNIEMI